MTKTAVSQTVTRANKLRRKGSAGMPTQAASGGGRGTSNPNLTSASSPDDEPDRSPKPRFDPLHPISSIRALRIFKGHQIDAYQTALSHERDRREHALKVATEEEKYRIEQSRILHDTQQEKRARQALTADGVKAAIDDLDGSFMVTSYAEQMLQRDVDTIRDDVLKERQKQHIYRVHQRILTKIEAATTVLEFDPDEFLPEED